MILLKSFRTEDGTHAALIGEAARIYTPVVYIDTPIKVRKIPNGDVARYTRDIKSRGPKPAARVMLKAGKSLGITKGAKKFLREVVKNG